MTLAVSEELHKAMKKHPEIKWTEVMRQAAEQKARELERKDPAWRQYAARHALEKWDDADELIKH